MFKNDLEVFLAGGMYRIECLPYAGGKNPSWNCRLSFFVKSIGTVRRFLLEQIGRVTGHLRPSKQ